MLATRAVRCYRNFAGQVICRRRSIWSVLGRWLLMGFILFFLLIFLLAFMARRKKTNTRISNGSSGGLLGFLPFKRNNNNMPNYNQPYSAPLGQPSSYQQPAYTPNNYGPGAPPMGVAEPKPTYQAAPPYSQSNQY